MSYKKLLDALTSEDIQFYLERSGWKKLEDNNKLFLRFRFEMDRSNIDIVLPKVKTSIDFVRRAEDIVRTLSSIFNLEPERIVQQIYSFDRDFVNLRLLDKNVSRNTISLILAERVIKSLNKLLKFAAAQTEQSKTYYMRPTEKAIRYADGLRFGHTFEGSFGFSVESPLSVPTIGMPEIGISLPFERQVVDRVYDGFEIVETATKSGTASIIVDNVIKGFNANMCEAIVEISEEIQAVDISYNFAWSPLVPVTIPNKLFRNFILSSRTYNILEDAARQLKNDVDEIDATIVGSVTILKAPPGFLAHEESLRLVTINGKTENGLSVNITTNLETDDYKLACDAHRDGKVVILKGHLLRGANRRWEITDYVKFTIAYP